MPLPPFIHSVNIVDVSEINCLLLEYDKQKTGDDNADMAAKFAKNITIIIAV